MHGQVKSKDNLDIENLLQDYLNHPKDIIQDHFVYSDTEYYALDLELT